jgi:hypothetical protein
VPANWSGSGYQNHRHRGQRHIPFRGQPIETIKRTKFTADAQAVIAHITKRDIGGLVLGMPRNMDGTEGPAPKPPVPLRATLTGCTACPSHFGMNASPLSPLKKLCLRRIRHENVALR